MYLCIMYYTVCYLTGIFYAVVRQISMLFIDNKIAIFSLITMVTKFTGNTHLLYCLYLDLHGHQIYR